MCSFSDLKDDIQAISRDFQCALSKNLVIIYRIPCNTMNQHGGLLFLQQNIMVLNTYLTCLQSKMVLRINSALAF